MSDKVPGAFFEVTGKFEELLRIQKAINDNDGRLTADSSASLDLWLEMKEEWFRLHAIEVEKNVERILKFSDELKTLFEGIEPIITEAVTQLADAIAATRKVSAWDVEYFHDDCPECEGCAEEAIKNAQEGKTLMESYRIMSPNADGRAIIGHAATVWKKES